MTAQVILTEDEARIEAGFGDLVERVAEQFDRGESEVFLTFKGTPHEKIFFASNYMTVREFDFGNAEKRNIAPAMVLVQCFKHMKGYGINFAYGTDIPLDSIKLVRA